MLRALWAFFATLLIFSATVAFAEPKPAIWQAWAPEYGYSELFKLGTSWPPVEPPFSTPEAACESAVHWVAKNENGTAAIGTVDPYEDAVLISFAGTGQRSTFPGRKCQIQDADGARPGDLGFGGWHSWKQVILRPFCNDSDKLGIVDGSPVCSPVIPDESQDCECTPGDTPVSAPPTISVGNPIQVDSGTKTAIETDYRSADGQLEVVRQYKSRPRNPVYMLTPLEIPGFSAQWHGLLPGILDIETSASAGQELGYLAFLSADGSVRRFLAGDTTGYTYTAIDQTRLNVTMVTTPTAARADYFKAPADTTSTGEVRLQFKNGEYILFRRAGTYDPANPRRVLVPVEHGQPGGYKQWFDYPDADIYPSRVRDSFGRQLVLTWTELGWTHNSVLGVHKGPGQATTPVGYAQERGISIVALPDGTALNYTYAATEASGYLGRLATITRKSASAATLWGRSYVYEDTRFPAAMTGILDQNGSRLSTYNYDQYERATLTQRAGGVQRYQIVYSTPSTDNTPQTRAVTNPLGLTDTYTYAAWSSAGLDPHTTPRRLLSISGAATASVPARTQSFSYTAQNQLQKYTDANGNVTSAVVDATNLRPSSIKNAGLVNQTFSYVPGSQTESASFDNPVQSSLSGKLVTNYSYDISGQLISRSDVDQTTAGNGTTRTTAYTWGPGGRLLAINGARNPFAHSNQDDVTTFTYDALGNRSTMTNALGNVTRYFGYDANGNVGLMTDPNGINTAYTYDALGRLSTVTVKHPTNAALDATISFSYDIESRISSLTRPGTAKLTFEYDLVGQLLNMRSDDGERIDYTYDAASNVLSETVRRADGSQSRATTRTFDELGRMLTETLGPGRTTTLTYDKNGNATQIKSPRANATTQGFDALDRLLTVAAPAAGTATNTYDSQDNLATFKDARAFTTTYTRNGFGDIIKEVSPDRGTTSYTYDDGGDLATMTDGRGQVVTFTRDILGRVTSKVPSGLTAQAVTYTWDTGGLSGSYDVGHIGKMVDGSGTTTFQYDHRGNVLIQQQAIGSTASAQLIYAYDLSDRIIMVTYPSGRQVQYNRDPKGRVVSVQTRATNAITTWTNLATGIQYEPFAAVSSMTLGNGLAVTNSWGNDGRLASRKLQKVSSGVSLSTLTYAFDNDDNIISITDGINSSQTQTYAYDAAGRVNQIGVATGTYKRTDYTYDANGNRQQEQRRTFATDTSPTQADTYTYSATSNRLTNVAIPTGNRAITYDGRGNTSSETRPSSVTVKTTYDGYDRLTAYTRTGVNVLSFSYNGRDDRVSSVNGTVTRRFVYGSDGRVMGEYGTSAADVKAEFFWLSPSAINDNEFGGVDGVSGYATLAVATPTSAGAIQVNWVYGGHLGVPLVTTDNTGNVATTPNDYFAPGFPGQSRILSDLYYNRYRDYDPSIGRYIQADPVGLGGGNNPYAYADNNPMRWTDPIGLAPRKLSPESEECKELLRKIENIRKKIVSRVLDIAGNSSRPKPLPEFAPGGKQRESVEGHREKLEEERDTLARREKEYAEKCGGGNCGDGVKAAAKIGAGIGMGYAAYRILRLIPSLVPVLWPTLPANVVVP